MILRWYAILASLTYIQKSNTVVALAQAGIQARLRLGWQVEVGARLTDIFKIIREYHIPGGGYSTPLDNIRLIKSSRHPMAKSLKSKQALLPLGKLQ